MSVGNIGIEAVQLSGEATAIGDEELGQLRAAMRGPVLIDGDPGYDESRIIFNATYCDCRPAMFAKCTGTADVVAAVNFAREHSLLTAVRGGGHGIPGFATCDGGLVIDLSPMNAVLVDADNMVVRAQGGALLGDLDHETERAGLVVPSGVVSVTGVGGLTLGGGLGWLHRKYGLSCDVLRSAEIVTADGQVLRASETQHPDLFWAIRGGGGNFGVVTEFEFDGFALGPMVMVALVAYPLEDLPEILPQWRAWTQGIPNEVTGRMIIFTPPDHPMVPEALLGRNAIFVGAMYAGSVEDGQTALDAVRHFGTPIIDLSSPMMWASAQSMLDLVGPGELGGYWKSAYIDSFTDEFLALVVTRAQNRPNANTVAQLITMGGAVSNLSETDTAFGYRGAPYMLSAESVWYDPQEADACTTWAREFVGDAEALGVARGTYLNFSGESGGELLSAQFGGNLERLRAVKREYDPENLFRRNNNIQPT